MSPANPKPLSEADLARVERVFTDVDGTLTTRDKLDSRTIAAIESLSEANIPVILVSGRPAGWAEAWARQLKVEAAICENGALYFKLRNNKLHKIYAQPKAQRAENRNRLIREVSRTLQHFKGAKLSSDSRYTEVDLAIDHNEDAKLPPGTAQQIEAYLRKRGVTAVRSSVHVNCWVGRFDKRSMVKRYLKTEHATTLRTPDPRFLYVGDSFNDAPLFDAFSLSIGVANVRAVLASIPHPPRYITKSAEGRGFEEVAKALLRAKGKR
ncbi:MAG: HAD family hydrolase [Myxococcaceae bacterium]